MSLAGREIRRVLEPAVAAAAAGGRTVCPDGTPRGPGRCPRAGPPWVAGEAVDAEAEESAEPFPESSSAYANPDPVASAATTPRLSAPAPSQENGCRGRFPVRLAVRMACLSALIVNVSRLLGFADSPVIVAEGAWLKMLVGATAAAVWLRP
jgi:hypothetical protein